MDSISLLAPDSTGRYYPISRETAGDLGLTFLAEQIAGSAPEQKTLLRILQNMPVSAEIIRYRNAVYRELRSDEALCTELFGICDSLRFSFNDRPVQIGEQSTIWELIQRFRSVEHYARSVLKLQKLFEGRKFASEGMQRLAEYAGELGRDSGFDALLEDLADLDEKVTRVRSITIGVNLNEELAPAEAGILSLNSYTFGDQSLLKNFLAFHRKDHISDRDLHPFTMEKHENGWDWFEKHFYGIQTPKLPSDSLLMTNLTSIIERMLPALTAKLKKVMDKYVHITGRALADLSDELLFYLRFISFEKRLREKGFACCDGKESSGDTVLTGFYNLRLAAISMRGETAEPIVTNEIAFTKERTVQILTGPNRGGKTILTQGIGIAFLMYQSGVFVPAETADIRLCDGIYTHFPVDEERTVSLGRLGEEAERFRKICEAATGDSLLLFNESFATTSHTESLYIAEDVLRYLCCLGARTCFNTHMHELAEHCEALCSSEKAVCGAVSMVMENGEENRYRITCRKPDGKSYAQVIARQYGITLEQLMKHL